MVNFALATEAITSATTKSVKSAVSVVGVALDFYAHNLEDQDPGLAKKRREAANGHGLVGLVETPETVHMTTFKHRKSEKSGSADEETTYKPTRKSHRCANPVVCAICQNQFQNLRRNVGNNNAQEPRIVVDQTNLDAWVPMGQPEDTINMEDEVKVGDHVKTVDSWEVIAVHGANEPLSTLTASVSNALDNATLARDGLVDQGGEEVEEVEPREVPALTRNNSNTSDDSIFGSLTPRELHSPSTSIIRPNTTNSHDEFETISISQVVKPPAKITSIEPQGLDNASLHRDMQSLRSARATLINHTPTTKTTTSTQLTKSANASLHAQLFSALHGRLSASNSTPVITASTTVPPLLTTISHTHARRRGVIIPSESSYTTLHPIILSPQNCQSLHTCSTTFHSDPIPCRFTHDSFISNPFLDSSSPWISSSTLGQENDFCSHSVIRNAQDARDEEIGVLEMTAMKKGSRQKKQKKSFSESEQEEEDLARDRHRLRKARGLNPEPVMRQEVFGRMF